ncbi:MAG: hypothetical protein HEQ32_04960 [Vampirovibrio sp.]
MTRPVPHGWKQAHLDTLIETLESGSRPKGGASTETGDIPSLGGENILQDGGIRFSPVRLVSSEFHGNMGKGLLKDNDVLINKDGANTGKVGFYHNSPFEQACINEHVFLIRGYRGKLDQGFLYYTLLSPEGSKQVGSKITGSAQPGLGTGFIRNFPILLPPLNEQEGIAAVLGSVDATIDATKQVITQTRHLKHALMQALLTRGLPGQHTQFKPSPLGTIPANWEVVKLGDVAQVERGKFSARPRNDPQFYGGNIPFIQTGDITSSNGLIDSYKQTLNELGLSVSRCFPAGTLFITIAANIGDVGIASFDCACPDSVVAITGKHNKVTQPWLLYSLRERKEHLDGLATQNAQKNINLEILRPLEILLPPLPEQEAIVGILNTVDARLVKETESLARLQTLKTALMQVLLTGEVRVPVALGVSRPAEYGETSPIAVREIVRQVSR